MAFKVVTICALLVFAKALTAQCIRTGLANIGLTGTGFGASGLGLGVIGNGLAGNCLAGSGLVGNGLASNGAGLIVTSTSPISPTGLVVLAENLELAGPVNVGGQLPLLAAVALEGQLPAGGQASSNYGCGNGNIGILSENVIAPSPVVPSGLGLGAGLSRRFAGLGGSGVGAGIRLLRRPCGAL